MFFKLLILLGLIGIVAGVIFSREVGELISSWVDVPKGKILLQIKDAALWVEVTDTPAKREKGLSGRTSLQENEAMLFVFPEPQKAAMWMKDMNFAIDIIWLNEQKEVVSIAENATPESFPEVFYPSQVALYALETNAGFVERYSIQIGDQAVW